MSRKLIVMAILALFAISSFVMAGEEAGKMKMKAMKGEHADFSGTLVCMGCSLKKSEGANSACKVYGHKHAILTDDGKYINLLENKFSADLVSGEKYDMKKVSAHGIYHASANQLDVETFSVDGQKKTWCDHCSAMDGCMAKK